MRFCLFLLGLLLFASSAQAAWYRVESRKFIFYGTSIQSLKEAAKRLERYDSYLRMRFDIPFETGENKLSVYVLPNAPQVMKAYGGNNRGIAGFYEANEAGVIAVMGRSEDEEWQDVVLFHEYAHHLMLQHFPIAYPAWYVEGFAELYSTTQFKGDKILLGLPANHRAYQLLMEDTVPIARLLGSSVSDLKQDEIGNFYGRAWLLTHYLNFNPTRIGQLSAYLKLINEGRGSLDAATQVFGDLQKLHRDMQQYLKAKNISYISSTFPAPDGLKISVTTLPTAFGETVMDRIRLRRGTRPDEREPLAERLRAAAKLFPDDADVWTLLAEAEMDAGHAAAAIAAADKALAIVPNASRALLWRGLGMIRQVEHSGQASPADWKAARSWIVRANRADTEDPVPLVEYYRSFRRAGLPVPPLAVDGLAKATAMVPQAAGPRFDYAYELARKGSFQMAAVYLQPIAASPHGGDVAQRAQQLVAALNRAAAEKTGEASLDLDAFFRIAAAEASDSDN